MWIKTEKGVRLNLDHLRSYYVAESSNSGEYELRATSTCEIRGEPIVHTLATGTKEEMGALADKIDRIVYTDGPGLIFVSLELKDLREE